MRAQLASAVLKAGMQTADLDQMARAITFHQRFGGGQLLSELNAEVQALAKGTAFDEIDSFVSVAAGSGPSTCTPTDASAKERGTFYARL